MDSSIKKYDFVDALRGWAILGVVFLHTFLWLRTVGGDPFNGLISNIALQGQRGVQLFYIVSAFTLFMSLSSRRQHEARPVANFFIRRFFRIAPLFYTVIIINVLIYGLSPRIWAPDGVEWWYIPLTASFLHGWMPQTINTVVEGGWSIAVETTFYALLPFLFIKLKDIRSTALFILGALVFSKVAAITAFHFLSPMYAPDQQYLVIGFIDRWFFSQAPTFGLGIMTYYVFKRYHAYRSKSLGVLLLLASLVLFALFSRFGTYVNTMVPEHFPYAAALCLFVLSLHFFPNRLFVNGIIQRIGKLSFSIYLINLPVVYIIAHLYRDVANRYAFNSEIGMIAAFLVSLMLSAGISLVTYRGVEVPGIRFGKRIIQKIEQHDASGSYSVNSAPDDMDGQVRAV